jgi:hypothetical protein
MESQLDHTEEPHELTPDEIEQVVGGGNFNSILSGLMREMENPQGFLAPMTGSWNCG